MGIRNLESKRRGQSLDELEADDWGPPPFDSYLVTTCHRLRKKPIGEFKIEDLRIMIGQEIGLLFLVPLALERIEADPLAEGDYYPGDLLVNVLRVSPEFWNGHAGWHRRLRDLLRRMELIPGEIAEEVERFQNSEA
ncbi:contact-dependent growth inhibition system immunity protein [Bythopirellula goksoeyrii]|uniref:Uncharacterized protein n=1 Tax=Bythopirellula goksoeyrii TaxID=1400387 RepID=A0A5B9QE09_9BACT|nr:contact-dependent growth inhibition system immunity protein [Bythopirellula goksoeyrii]QEG37307.1 hypothetical protein Pr1d_46480 [Bythopirellula goksoeyrii]